MAADDLSLARDAVLEAGAVAMTFFRQGHATWEKEPGQVVTDADIAVDRLLHERLIGARPDDAWLSEESVDDGRRLGAERVWIVDPIDGTRSFAEGTPEFTISVALVSGGRPVLGLLLNPATGQFFEAVRGGGARLDGEPIRTTARTLAGARIVCSESENRRRRFDTLLPGSDVSSIGSLALKLALVAAGRFDGYLTWRRTHDWDIAAAMLLIEEAGGVITDGGGAAVVLNREVVRHDGILAAAPALHRDLLAATLEAREAMLKRRS